MSLERKIPRPASQPGTRPAAAADTKLKLDTLLVVPDLSPAAVEVPAAPAVPEQVAVNEIPAGLGGGSIQAAPSAPVQPATVVTEHHQSRIEPANLGAAAAPAVAPAAPVAIETPAAVSAPAEPAPAEPAPAQAPEVDWAAYHAALEAAEASAGNAQRNAEPATQAAKVELQRTASVESDGEEKQSWKVRLRETWDSTQLNKSWKHSLGTLVTIVVAIAVCTLFAQAMRESDPGPVAQLDALDGHLLGAGDGEPLAETSDEGQASFGQAGFGQSFGDNGPAAAAQPVSAHMTANGTGANGDAAVGNVAHDWRRSVTPPTEQPSMRSPSFAAGAPAGQYQNQAAAGWPPTGAMPATAPAAPDSRVASQTPEANPFDRPIMGAPNHQPMQQQAAFGQAAPQHPNVNHFQDKTAQAYPSNPATGGPGTPFPNMQYGQQPPHGAGGGTVRLGSRPQAPQGNGFQRGPNGQGNPFNAGGVIH